MLLDEIVAQVAGRRGWSTRGCVQLREHDPMLADTLQAYLDGFGDIAARGRATACAPEHRALPGAPHREATVTSLADPDDRLVLSLGLRATAS